MSATQWTQNAAYDASFDTWDSSTDIWDNPLLTWDSGTASLVTPAPTAWTAVEP